MSTNIIWQTEPGEWERLITNAKRERSKAKVLLKSANNDLNLDADDGAADTIKKEAQRDLSRIEILLRYLDAELKWSKDKNDTALTSAKKEESRLAADARKKALDDYDNGLKKSDGKKSGLKVSVNK